MTRKTAPRMAKSKSTGKTPIIDDDDIGDIEELVNHNDSDATVSLTPIIQTQFMLLKRMRAHIIAPVDMFGCNRLALPSVPESVCMCG